MKKRKRASSSTLFLMELIIAIMFFALAATVCIAVFVRAHVLSRDSRRINMASNQCSDAAEIIRTQTSLSGIRSIFLRLYPNVRISGPDSNCEIQIYFDDAFREIDGDHAVFTETISLQSKDGLLNISIAVTDSEGEAIYSLELVHDLQEGGTG